MPVFRTTSPSPIAASGEAFRVERLSDVPDFRPSPTVDRWVMPCFITSVGGRMFTTLSNDFSSSRAKLEPLPGTTFMPGSGGGWAVPLLCESRRQNGHLNRLDGLTVAE